MAMALPRHLSPLDLATMVESGRTRRFLLVARRPNRQGLECPLIDPGRTPTITHRLRPLQPADQLPRTSQQHSRQPTCRHAQAPSMLIVHDQCQALHTLPLVSTTLKIIIASPTSSAPPCRMTILPTQPVQPHPRKHLSLHRTICRYTSCVPVSSSSASTRHEKKVGILTSPTCKARFSMS